MPDPDATIDRVQAPASPRRCTATRADGGRCRAWASAGSTTCWAHRSDAEGEAEARDRRASGGRARANAARAAKSWAAAGAELSAADLPNLALGIVAGLLSGEISPGVAAGVASAIRTHIAAAESAAVFDRLGEIEAAIDALTTAQARAK